MKATFNSLLLLILTISLIGCNKKLPTEDREILAYRLSPEHDILPYDSLKTYEIQYKIALAANENYGYLVYRIISQYDPKATVVAEEDKITIIQSEILQKGLLKDLSKSESDPRYKEFDFNYSFKLENTLFGESSNFTKHAYLQSIGNKRLPCSLDFITNIKNSGLRTIQHIGVILYEFPFPKQKIEDYNIFKAERQKIIDNNNFDIDSLANSKKYKHYYLKSAVRRLRKSKVSFNFGQYVER